MGIPYGTVIGDGDVPGTVRVIGAGTAPATAVTTDGGASWLSDGGFSGAPVGARGGAASISLGREMYVYDVAECTTARMVYSLSRDSTLDAPLAVTSWFLDESKTAALIPNEYTTRGSNSAGANALFAVSPSAGVRNVRSISGGQTSPEQVFGVDGYGVTRRGVSASSGNFTHSETDASVSTVGPELTVVRSYNSMDGRVGMFGRGWTSTFETRVLRELRHEGRHGVAW